jgi:hypothetical protein
VERSPYIGSSDDLGHLKVYIEEIRIAPAVKAAGSRFFKGDFYAILNLMKSILDFHIESGNFHHGYLLVGDFEKAKDLAFNAAKTILAWKEKLESHPDFFYKKYDLFSIDDSHGLISKASQRPLAGDKKVFVVELSGFSLESANSLLKTFEEPYEGTYFFVLLPSLDEILPTLRSRLVVVNVGKENIGLDEEKTKLYKKFINSNTAKRLEMVKEFSDDRFDAMEFLNGLEVSLGKSDFRNEISRCRTFLLSRGASAKMVLEHIALAMPEIV